MEPYTNNKPTIVYINLGFADTDITVIKHLTRDFNVHWFVILNKNYQYNENFFRNYVKGTEITLHLYPFSCRRREWKMFKLFRNCMKEIKNLHPKLIFTAIEDAYFSLNYLWYCRNIPYIMGIHDVQFHSNVKRSIAFKFSYWLNQRISDICVQYNKNQFDLFKALYPKKNNYLVGMSVKDFGTPTVTPPSFNGIVKILFFGTICSYKGYEQLITNFEKLLSEGATTIQLSFYGKCKDEEVEDFFRNNIHHSEKYNLQLKYINNDDIPNIFVSHHFAIFPYKDATQSGPLMIAANYNIPVIAPNHSCFKDIYTNEKNGIIYNAEDNNGLYLALKEVSLMSKEKYSQMLNNCRILREQYSEENIAQNYILLFKQIIENKGKSITK